MKANNKWINGAIPALLIHCSIGTVYCWSLVKDQLLISLNSDKSVLEWSFSLAIFFLGMSAAFFGKLVEKNVKLSGFISTACFTLGMIGTGISISLNSIIGVLLSYGCIMGIGLGVGYLTPVKTLMMWFKEHKGLATGIAITGFGLAKVIASPIIQYLLSITTIENMFYILGASYFLLMLIGSLLIKKPENKDDQVKPYNVKELFGTLKTKKFLIIWIVFYLNITCGLALISEEKSLFTQYGLGAFVTLLASFTAALNAGGRFGYSTMSDMFKNRVLTYKILFLTSSLSCLFAFFGWYFLPIAYVSIILCLLVCNAGYGGGFSTLPSLLADEFGMKNVSLIHGVALSAWAFAGLSGNQMANAIVNGCNHSILLLVLTLIYMFALFLTTKIK